jgi:hypothetical protein
MMRMSECLSQNSFILYVITMLSCITVKNLLDYIKENNVSEDAMLCVAPLDNMEEEHIPIKVWITTRTEGSITYDLLGLFYV